MGVVRVRLLSLLCLVSVGFPAFDLAQRTVKTQDETKRAVTVADAIAMARLADPDYFSGANSQGRVAQFSPDGKHFTVVLRRGTVETNTNEYSIYVFQAADLFQSPKADVLVKMESSSNRAAIRNVKWLKDNETISFVGENPGESAQVYIFNIRTKHLERKTHHPTAINNFDMSPDGNEIVFVADAPRTKRVYTDGERREGVVLNDQSLEQLLSGDCPQNICRAGHLFVKTQRHESVRIPSSDAIFDANVISMSPDGRFAIVTEHIQHLLPEWAGYEDRTLRQLIAAQGSKAQMTYWRRYLVLDTQAGTLKPLLNTPMLAPRKLVWASDSRSLTLNSYLPLNVAEPAEREARAKQEWPVEVTLPSRSVRRLTEDKYLAEVNDKSVNSPEIALEESVNAPPKIYATDSRTKQKTMILDLNPQFSGLDLGNVEIIQWKVRDKLVVKGGLYLPPDYVVGKRYPVMIQTHGFNPDSFSMDGLHEWSSAYAARPLAACGVVVLQAYRFSDRNAQNHYNDDKSFGHNADEAGRALNVELVEAALDYLDQRGIVDLSRVGISGFSRTVSSTGYLLTHSKHKFAAAVMTDGIDGGYFQYLLFPASVWEFDAMNGGAAPFGAGLKEWLKESPSFSLANVDAPLRVVAIGPASPLVMWEWYSALRIQKKPVEFIQIPDGVHLLEKPWERRIAMQGIVDWFRFWLKGEEDPDPAKTEQYARWDELRKLQEENDAKARAQVTGDRPQ